MAPQNFRFFIFFKNRLQILAMTVFGLRCLLEASKNLPRASQELPQSPQEALHSLQEPAFGPPRGLQQPALQTCLQSWTDNNDRWPVTVQSIVGIIDRWSKESLIVGRWQDIKDKGSMQARWRTNAPAVMDIYIYIYIYNYMYMCICMLAYNSTFEPISGVRHYSSWICLVFLCRFTSSIRFFAY